jgi:hypothetical protein
MRMTYEGSTEWNLCMRYPNGRVKAVSYDHICIQTRVSVKNQTQ